MLSKQVKQRIAFNKALHKFPKQYSRAHMFKRHFSQMTISKDTMLTPRFVLTGMESKFAGRCKEMDEAIKETVQDNLHGIFEDHGPFEQPMQALFDKGGRSLTEVLKDINAIDRPMHEVSDLGLFSETVVVKYVMGADTWRTVITECPGPIYVIEERQDSFTVEYDTQAEWDNELTRFNGLVDHTVLDKVLRSL